jgi:hypothetical protein
MKKQIILITILLLANIVNAQWQWAKQIGGPNSDGGGARIDANNNIYCTGVFYGTCYFDNDTLYSLGVNDIFLAKYNASGNEVWSKRIGGNNPMNFDEWAGQIVIDNANNCLYLSGTFYGSLTIDSYTIYSSGGLDMFLAKFDLNGNCLWLKRAGSPLEDLLGTVSVDPNGNIYWTGYFHYTAGLVDTASVPTGWFLAKFDTNGSLISVTPDFINGGSPSWLTVSNNEIIVTGSAGSSTFIINGNDTLIGSSTVDGFLFKMDLSLNVTWAKRFGGNTSYWDYPSTFEQDTNGNIYLVGGFQDSLTIGSTTITNAGKKDMFFAKFDSGGSLVWVKQANATGAFTTIANMIRKDSDGLFYIIGSFNGSANFGSYNVSTTNNQDVFIARYDDNGDCLGVRHFGFAVGGSVEVDSNGDIIIAGGFSNTINIGSTSLTSYGGGDMFFAKSDAITGIGEGNSRMANNQLFIYANPNAGKCNITVPDDFLNEKNLTLSIYDNIGRLIQQQTLEMNEGKIKINLEQEAKGIYNVTLSSKKKSYNGKIVFE